MAENGTTLERLARRLSGGIVLAFHEIAPAHFAELVDSLGRRRPVPLTELVGRAARGASTHGLFAITVDDGVGDNVRGLAQVLAARSWPATFYLCVDYVDRRVAMPFQQWRKLEPFLSSLPPSAFARLGPAIGASNVAELSAAMHRLWRTQRPDAYVPPMMRLVEMVIRDQRVDASLLAPPEAVTWPEVEALSATGLIRFESHGMSHAAMSALTGDEMTVEMKQSRDLIAAHTGYPCRHFAYPFGGPASIGERAARAARAYYDSAATMLPGSVDGADPWLLPRVPLYQENSRAFAWLKVVLSCSAFSPLRVRRAAEKKRPAARAAAGP